MVDELHRRGHLQPRLAEGEHAGQVGRAHAGREGADCPVGAGMTVAADDEVARPHQPLLGQHDVGDPLAPLVVDVGDSLLPRPPTYAGAHGGGAGLERMLAASRRRPDELLGEMPPNYGRLTVEKVAINAVMAGCRPDYLPIVIAAAECACDPAFNLHGVASSTHFSAPLIIVNGPIRARVGINSGVGVFGPGWRANATIGRALRLLMINIGGARPGQTSMSTFGHPGPYPYCAGENEGASPWPPYHVDRGLAAATSAVTLFAGEAPHGISDHASRTARALAGSLGWSMVGLWNSKHFPLYSHTLLVVGPEHARTFADDGWTKADLARHLHETIRRPYRELLPDEGHGEGTNLRHGASPPALDALVPKFPSPDEIHVIVAGGTARRCSVAIPGWLGTKNGSSPVTRPIEFDLRAAPSV